MIITDARARVDCERLHWTSGSWARMAFNFNWSPLAADTSFYERAQELLTAALNKSPKPPIIVDDILVHEMNLGSVPPDLEILEVGDLAEDRFRGIFKMTYAGDAFLTLKTRVQVWCFSSDTSSDRNQKLIVHTHIYRRTRSIPTCRHVRHLARRSLSLPLPA